MRTPGFNSFARSRQHCVQPRTREAAPVLNKSGIYAFAGDHKRKEYSLAGASLIGCQPCQSVASVNHFLDLEFHDSSLIALYTLTAYRTGSTAGVGIARADVSAHIAYAVARSVLHSYGCGKEPDRGLPRSAPAAKPTRVYSSAMLQSAFLPSQ